MLLPKWVVSLLSEKTKDGMYSRRNEEYFALSAEQHRTTGNVPDPARRKIIAARLHELGHELVLLAPDEHKTIR